MLKDWVNIPWLLETKSENGFIILKTMISSPKGVTSFARQEWAATATMYTRNK